jgi:hypothetical protein
MFSSFWEQSPVKRCMVAEHAVQTKKAVRVRLPILVNATVIFNTRTWLTPAQVMFFRSVGPVDLKTCVQIYLTTYLYLGVGEKIVLAMAIFPTKELMRSQMTTRYTDITLACQSKTCVQIKLMV